MDGLVVYTAYAYQVQLSIVYPKIVRQVERRLSGRWRGVGTVPSKLTDCLGAKASYGAQKDQFSC